jgi:hypothetical protein
MRAYMPNVDGKGEDRRLGRVVILQDTDGDGKMDRSTVFLDGLQLPRAIALAYDGVLVAEPPNLWFCRDTNNDGVCDEKTLIAQDYGSQANPEHTANGLLWAIDNWIYSANSTNRLHRVGDKWIQEPTAVLSGRGQWGISQDDFGRLVFNSNSDYLRGDLVPPELLFRNPNLPNPYGANVQFDKNQETFPIRPNTGVNRGYQKTQLRADGSLASFTATCAPLIYRGDQFDPSFYGCAFVCEPAGNFVRCSRLSEKNGVITATNAFPNAEFLASAEERFRPVNLYNGPDGALYIADLHRGVIEHHMYVTTYLRHQITSRSLEEPLNLGRIYRVVQENRPRRKPGPLRTNTLDLLRISQIPMAGRATLRNGYWSNALIPLRSNRSQQLRAAIAKITRPLTRFGLCTASANWIRKRSSPRLVRRTRAFAPPPLASPANALRPNRLCSMR